MIAWDIAQRRQRRPSSLSLRDARTIGESIVVVTTTWLLLGWYFDRAITQSDGTVFWAPYTQSALDAGANWTHHLYRFGVLGGSPMHDFAGTLPVVQLCGLLGTATTTTLNVVTLFIQLCFAFLGIKLIEALITEWQAQPAKLSAPQRITAVWACAFAPVLAWRLAYGHENLLLGLLPFVSAITLFWCARARTLTATTVVFAFFAVFNGLSTTGAQTIAYGAIFGLPLLAVTVLGAPRGSRWSKDHTVALLVLASAAMVALPRVWGMVVYASGPDGSRGLGDVVTYSYPGPSWSDWLRSVPWRAAGDHEHNFPLGPLIVLVAFAWPRSASRRTTWALLAGASVALLFAQHAPLISDLLLRAIPPLRAFRVPARALLPMLVLIPAVALAAFWTHRLDSAAKPQWLAVGLGGLVIVGTRGLPPIYSEFAAWAGCVALVINARRPFVREGAAALAVVAALGVTAFDQRFPRGVPYERIEEGPRRLHDAMLEQAPDLAMPLNRVQLVDAPPPYEMSTAFAARLSSLDGDYNPTGRFLLLLSALSGKALPATTVVFKLAHNRAFPILQQLYNVRYAVSLGSNKGSILTLPDTPGPAWLPGSCDVIENPDAMAGALRRDPRAARDRCWVLEHERPAQLPIRCTGAAVESVATDVDGQVATIETHAASPCTLVVATNFVSSLHATIDGNETDIFPVDIALTGIAIPSGHSRVILKPRADIPWWTRAIQFAGVALLAVSAAYSLGMFRRRS